VGLEMDPRNLIATVRKSIPISMAGIALPFTLGVGISKLIYDMYADQSKPFSSFTIFLGVAMSITAFPVLARILSERKLLHTTVGSATLSAAAVDDFMAWTLLILVMSLVNNTKEGAKASDYAIAFYVFMIVIGYAMLLWFAVRPGILYLVKLSGTREHVSQFLLFVVFSLVLISAWFTEVIGVHAIFGSFLVGVIIPHENGFARHLADQIEDLVTIVFLPLYFAYSGLNTRIDTLNDGAAWGVTLLVIIVACGGKIVGCTLSSKVSGMNWRESFAVGILMNTKGLVEIIVLNLGLSSGIINEKIFSMFVVMAVATTVMTVPIISVVYPEAYYLKINRSNSSSDLSSEDPISHSDLKPSTTPEIPATSNLTVSSLTGLTAAFSSENDIRALAVIPSLSAVPSTMSFTTVAAAAKGVSPGAFQVTALRLIEVSERMSSVMLANEYNETLRTDALLSVFRTFADIHRLRSKSLLGVITDRSSFAPTILSAIKESHSNLILLPWYPHKPQHDQQHHDFDGHLAHTTYQDVFSNAENLGATIVLFLDRGFGRKTNTSVSARTITKKRSNLLQLESPSTWAPSSPTAAAASPILSDHQEPTRVSSISKKSITAPRPNLVFVIHYGTSEDCEDALRIGKLMALGSAGVGALPTETTSAKPTPAKLVILHIQTPATTDPTDSFQTLRTQLPPNTLHIETLDTSSIPANIPILPENPESTIQSMRSSRANTTASQADPSKRHVGGLVVNTIEEVLERFGEKNGLGGQDVVVVGEKVIRAARNGHGQAGLMQWLESPDCGGSVAVVKGVVAKGFGSEKV
ncbi:K(+)/H(+) antiporter, partial [Phlyctochytrium planicorne]